MNFKDVHETHRPKVPGKFKAIPKEEFNRDDFVNRDYVCMYLGVSKDTLMRWYDWYFDEEIIKPARTPSLPHIYKVDGNLFSPQYFARRDLPRIARFHTWLPRGRAGIMGGGKRKKKKKD